MKRRFRIIIRFAYLQTWFFFFTLIVKNVHMKANILRIFSSFLRYNKHAKLFVQRWHHFWSSKIDHYFTKQRISKKMLIFYLCVRSVILGFIKILTELFVQLFLKRRGKTIPRKNYLHWVFFFKAGRAVTIEILLYLPDTSRFYLTRGICNVEMFRLLQNTVVIHIAYSFILC